MWNKVKSFFGRFWAGIRRTVTKWTVYEVLVAIGQAILVGLACTFTFVALSIALGPIGVLMSMIMIFATGALYAGFIDGEENCVRWFPTVVLGLMVSPYFAAVTGGSAIATVLLTAGFVWALDALRTLSGVIGVGKLLAREAAA